MLRSSEFSEEIRQFTRQSNHTPGLLGQKHMSHVTRKPAFCICENKDADQLHGSVKLICVFVFATWIVQSLYFLNTNFQASSHLMWLYSPVCGGPGRKPRRPAFSQRGSYKTAFLTTQLVYNVGFMMIM